MVECNVANVVVAGSNPVSRLEKFCRDPVRRSRRIKQEHKGEDYEDHRLFIKEGNLD